MISQDIRRRFIKFFKDQGHAHIASSPVVPHDDPTLLFINAGMNQFKDVFLGKAHRDYKRATTSQKCIRVGGKHNDLDNVGHTSRHLTFFEMLGNFSFGDYFKEKAIEFAFKVSVEVFEFSTEHLWITIFQEDEEAFELWQKYMPKNRIIRMDEKDNFWAMGDTGPCGPCSELYYDRGAKYGSASSPKEDAEGKRYLEFWNLVFMQFNRDGAGKFHPLPQQSIDTGAGLERIASLKMNVDSVFATDILRSLIAEVEHISGKKYHAEDTHAPAFHVIADHIRSLSFAIADGAQPSNIDRGYVLRKLVRRAVRYGRGLGMMDPFLGKILPCLIKEMGEDYHELKSAEARIAEILFIEEEAFLRTLKRGGNILNSVIEKAQKSPLKQISGEEAFKLKDTYGLPLEEILLIAKDSALQVNLESYQLLEEQAKEKSRQAQTVHSQVAEESLFKDFSAKHPNIEFVGYTEVESESTILGICVEGAFVPSLTEGQEAIIILNKTPFYAEKGGQVGDKGYLSHHNALFEVTDCQTPYQNVIAHFGKLKKGTLLVGEPVVAKIDVERREEIKRHHTATHLMHWALQKVLGEHIRQAGSLVEPTRLRFDFNHHKALSSDEIRQIEEMVNKKIRQDQKVANYELSYEEAQKRSDIKQFFGEKYGSKVRVVDIEYSKELCGGTHVERVGTLGLFRITKESSIAAGVRRIEALTGKGAEAFMYHNEDMAHEAAALLKAPAGKLVEKISALLEENKHLLHELKTAKRFKIKQLAVELAEKIRQVGAYQFLAEVVEVDAEGLQLLSEELMHANRSLILLLGIKGQDRCQILARVSSDLVQKGVQAVSLVKEIASFIGGAGGGKADSAQAGGKQIDGLIKAFEEAKKIVQAL